jgi:hypothetical protein
MKLLHTTFSVPAFAPHTRDNRSRLDCLLHLSVNQELLVVRCHGRAGLGPGLFAVVFATLWADFRYALPEYDFAITEWEDATGLATFAILGALIAFIIQEFVSLGE